MSRALGHNTPLVTLCIYTHAVQQRASNSLAAKAEAFLVAEETDGCGMVVGGAVDSRKRA